ncbi:MAG: ComF family protein [Ilumatobacteraceae bacterium]|jgi:predicted amidophosphoribosyltransferase
MSSIIAPASLSKPVVKRSSVARLLDAVFTTRCAGCDAIGAPLCHTCRFILLEASRIGPSAGTPDGVITAVSMTGSARRVIHGLKYRNRRAVVEHVAGMLAARVLAAGIAPHSDVTAVTWAPTHPDRRRSRGYDQAELLARGVARCLGLPVVRLLERVDNGAPQTGRSRDERLGGPAFTGRRSRHRAVLLIDDVVTTGSTLAAARGALRTAGVSNIVSAAVAATPARAHRSGTRSIPTAA